MKANRLIVFFITSMMCAGASAGLIRNGMEWEVRGDVVSWDDHATAAAADASLGWIWADLAAFQSATFLRSLLSDPDWSALMGALDGINVLPDVFLATEVSAVTAYKATTDGLYRADDSAGQYVDEISGAKGIGVYRLSYRRVDVPEPTTLALLGLGLAGVGFSRRKTR